MGWEWGQVTISPISPRPSPHPFDYQGDIQPFEKVFITAITQTQLADIALGRDSQPVTCALSNALLYGKEIFLYDSALAHRKLAGRGSSHQHILPDACPHPVGGNKDRRFLLVGPGLPPTPSCPAKASAG